ncbi:hypothetical protein BJ508DRAFT_333818 [Ascobolus immersus RN42]|uniref:Uncharacterized protein n=1 Tax=Ascobolus immersus RN42 TaxID=1160509 RepID=A0A3N4HVK2_ASCIM|nr:hypothetical protein BJ508DRAFT_333818 [Ascobolus immersus RN42]
MVRRKPRLRNKPKPKPKTDEHVRNLVKKQEALVNRTKIFNRLLQENHDDMEPIYKRLGWTLPPFLPVQTPTFSVPATPETLAACKEELKQKEQALAAARKDRLMKEKLVDRRLANGDRVLWYAYGRALDSGILSHATFEDWRNVMAEFVKGNVASEQPSSPGRMERYPCPRWGA